MIDQNTDFFKIEDNFAKTAHIQSIPIFEAKIDFVPKITIAIPTYKRAVLLKEALESAINQTNFNEYDIIVVDNNPERGCDTETMMLNYQNRRVSYYKNVENIGMFGNWNRCITLARGEYLTILNDDDLLLSNYLSKSTDFINKKANIDMLYVGCSILKNNEIKSNIAKINNYRVTLSDFVIGPSSIGSLGLLFKKNRIISLGGFNPDFYPTSDYIFFTLCAKSHKHIYKINNILAVYRLAENESLKLYVQERNLIQDSILRKQISNFSHFNHIIKSSLVVKEYKQFLNICSFSTEFNAKYYDKNKSLYRKKIRFHNLISYYLLILLLKTKKILYN